MAFPLQKCSANTSAPPMIREQLKPTRSRAGAGRKPTQVAPGPGILELGRSLHQYLSKLCNYLSPKIVSNLLLLPVCAFHSRSYPSWSRSWPQTPIRASTRVNKLHQLVDPPEPIVRKNAGVLPHQKAPRGPLTIDATARSSLFLCETKQTCWCRPNR